MNEVKFRISSFLKDLIGRELITDEFVAVFELVKNSFDANANKVISSQSREPRPREIGARRVSTDPRAPYRARRV